jgi:uncharacterized membrane protein
MANGLTGGDLMQTSQLFYLPLAPVFFLILVLFFVFLVIFVEIRAVRYAYMQLGVSSRTALFLLFGSLLGSYINIPVAEIPNQVPLSSQVVQFFGMEYQVPQAVGLSSTIIAVNVGGALIPVIVSFYLLNKYDLWLKGLAATAIIAATCHSLAWLIPGVGVAVPIFVPALATAIVAFIIDRNYIGPLAYVAGSLGTLIGADLMNLNKVAGLGVPVASIGGAGTFDGIFLTSIAAVLLGSIAASPRSGRHAVEPRS